MQRTKQEDALISQVANLRKKLIEKERELNDYRASQIGIAVGDVVVSNDKRFRVARVLSWSMGVQLKVNAAKKDGTFGNREINLCGKWTKEASHAE